MQKNHPHCGLVFVGGLLIVCGCFFVVLGWWVGVVVCVGGKSQ